MAGRRLRRKQKLEEARVRRRMEWFATVVRFQSRNPDFENTLVARHIARQSNEFVDAVIEQLVEFDPRLADRKLGRDLVRKTGAVYFMVLLRDYCEDQCIPAPHQRIPAPDSRPHPHQLANAKAAFQNLAEIIEWETRTPKRSVHTPTPVGGPKPGGRWGA